ncbi:hypothetical protein [Pedosphaera parvula]|uniref:hypothetical protein n=1 Tax=Pedosphaera parvula TaxID=1032527 RepID=UPI00123769BD|nr:hypothetical protein [Pedosphaera parvula]
MSLVTSAATRWRMVAGTGWIVGRVAEGQNPEVRGRKVRAAGGGVVDRVRGWSKWRGQVAGRVSAARTE